MTQPLNILVIENRNADFLMIERRLKQNGLSARCRRVESLEGLKEAIAGEGWDLVLADYNVPQLNFQESLKLLLESLADVPVILISGSIGEEKAVELLKLGVRDFVLKDNLVRLVPAVLRALKEKGALEERKCAELELSRYREHLEELVKERTMELELRNQQLDAEVEQHKLTEETLRRYARRLVVLEEEMRRKLAAELHDELGRDLTALGLNFTIIGNNLSRDSKEKLSERINDSSSLIEEMGRIVRELMIRLRPPVLDDYGLVAALRSHAELFAKRTGIAVDFQMEEIEPRLSDEVETAFYRIAQEALTNVTKHAGARCVTLRLERFDGRARLLIGDDGRGFDPRLNRTADPGAGWGLTIMRERAESVGARFRLDSQPGRGTVIIVETGEVFQ